MSVSAKRLTIISAYSIYEGEFSMGGLFSSKRKLETRRHEARFSSGICRHCTATCCTPHH